MWMLKARRYGKNCREEVKDFIRFQLHGLEFKQAMKYYNSVVKPTYTKDEWALLGANDRFFLMTEILGLDFAQREWLYKRAREVELNPDGCLDLWARGHFKDQKIDTPVLTTRGFKKHGELKVGDFVFNPDGKPVMVQAVTEHYTTSQCYRITFDNNAEIICGAGHEWKVGFNNRSRIKGTNKRVGKDYKIVCTEDLALMKEKWDSVPSMWAHPLTVRRAKPLNYPHRNLPIEPYTLGIWLGDGSKRNGTVTSGDPEVFEEIQNDLYFISKPRPCDAKKNSETRTVYGLQGRLRKLGLLGNKSKKIPVGYLRASIEQRLALLQGLMDSDGHVEARGTATFCNKNESLADLVFELASGLGYKVQKRVYDYGGKQGKFWQVSFQSRRSMCPFRIPRKVANVLDRDDMKDWKITSIDRVETVLTNCIQVEGGMYLCGKELIPTHNSTIITFTGVIQEVIRNPEITIAIFSEKRVLSEKFLEQIQVEMESNSTLKKLYSDVFYLNPRRETKPWSVQKGLKVRRKGNPKEATVEAAGLLQGMPTSRHYDLLIYDDCVTLDVARSQGQVEKAIEAFQHSTNLGKETYRVWYIGTRYSFRDPYGWMMEENMVEPRIYPATHNGREDGKPVLLTETQLANWKRRQPDAFHAQMLQDPLTGKEQMFKPEQFKPYEIRPEVLNVYIMVDPASGRRGKDNTAMVVLGVDKRENKYFLDGYSHKMTLDERWRNMARLQKKWINEPGVEFVAVGYERYGMQSDLDYFEGKMREKGQNYFPIEELNWPSDGTESKKDRVQRLQADFNDQKFYIPNVVRKFRTEKDEEGIKTGWYDYEWFMQTSVEDLEDLRKVGMQFKLKRGNSRLQQVLLDAKRDYRVVKPILRKDEQGRAYDMSEKLIQEFLYFPLGQNDDICDSASRIYDMDFVPPLTGLSKDPVNMEFEDA